MAQTNQRSNQETVASLRNLSKIYGSGETKVLALKDVNLDFGRGSFTAIMGPSGSGKSTLLYCLAALDAPSAGQIYIDGFDIGQLRDRQLTKLRQSHFGFIFQAYNLIPTLTAAENIMLPLQIARRSTQSSTLRSYYKQLVETLGIAGRLRHLPGELSGGQQQRVAAARALITRPRMIIADEPSGNLDTKSSGELLEFFRFAVKNYQQTMVMVTHDVQAAAFAERVVFLKDGAVVDTLDEPVVTTILAKLNTLEGAAAKP